MLAMPLDAPQLECQRCLAARPPGGSAANVTNRPSGNQTQAALGNESSEINPALRLPDNAAKLVEYEQNRSKLFASTERTRTETAATEQEEENQGVGNTAWEKSWSQLREALLKKK